MNLLVFLLSYLMGSLSPSHILARKTFKEDLQGKGSGNLGALNTYRNYGSLAGALVFLLDAAKGALSVYLALLLAVNPFWALAGVVCGHNYSVFLKFKGGKGLASAFGALLLIDFRYAAVLVMVGAVILAFSRNKYPTSVLSAGLLPVVILYFDPSPLSLVLGLFTAFLIIVKHRHNFQSWVERNK